MGRRIHLAVALAVFVLASPAEATTRSDARDTPRSQLDLRRVTLDQKGSRARVVFRTHSRWTARTLRRGTLCLHLPGGRLCVVAQRGRAVLRRTLADGRTSWRVPSRRAGRSFVFLPAAAALPVGRLDWRAESTYESSRCADRADCTDELSGTTRVTLSGRRRCFGAAASDRGCTDPRPRGTTIPAPRGWQPPLTPLCDARPRMRLVAVCSFGAPPDRARHTFAVIGDSHAAAWKPALEVVTHAKDWHGYSLFRAGCPPTAAATILPTTQRSRDCDRWNRQVRQWLGNHPSVSTVFLSSRTGARVHGDPVAGYRRGINRLPRSIKRVIVLRDNPTTPSGTIGCVRRALRARLHPGTACDGGTRVHPDPLAAAARSTSRGSVIDLTHRFCPGGRCRPVLGGALVFRDTSHVTTEFSTSLGPYLARALGG